MASVTKTLLCVDDEPTGLLIRKMLLEAAGFRVLTAENPAQALDLFCCELVDAVVLDYLLPDVDGGTMVARLRQINAHVPILLLSASFSVPGEVLRQVDAHVTKGESPDVLINSLLQLLADGHKNGAVAA